MESNLINDLGTEVVFQACGDDPEVAMTELSDAQWVYCTAEIVATDEQVAAVVDEFEQPSEKAMLAWATDFSSRYRRQRTMP